MNEATKGGFLRLKPVLYCTEPKYSQKCKSAIFINDKNVVTHHAFHVP